MEVKLIEDCPWCGSAPPSKKPKTVHVTAQDNHGHVVTCPCGAQSPYCSKPEAAVTVWNDHARRHRREARFHALLVKIQGQIEEAY